MRSTLLLSMTFAAGEYGAIAGWMEQAFYPALLLVLVVASLGVPIPEDVPLILAGVILKTHPATASPLATFCVAMVGIMAGDLVLYMLGRRWGPGVVDHRSVRWIITAERFARIARRFQHHGTWFCFFGRFFMGVRSAMCLTAGATRFPYWRFLIADFCGALISVPLFILLGYWFAGMIPELRRYITGVQALMTIVGLIVVGSIYLAYRRRRARTARPATTKDAAPPTSRPGRRPEVPPRRAARPGTPSAKPEVSPPAR